MPSTLTKSKKPSILLWQDLDVQQLHILKESNDKLKTLAELFSLKDHKENLKSAILLDLYFYIVQFAEKNGFDEEQTSAFFSIVKSVHEKTVETPYGNMDEVYLYFKELLLCHSVKRPPFSVQIFDSNQVQSVTNYVINTYFKNFKLYKYTFTAKVRLDLTFEYPNMPDTPTPEEETTAENGELGSSYEVEANDIATANKATDDDSLAMKELKNYITATLNEQVNKLQLSIDEQIVASNEKLSQKLGFTYPSDKEHIPKSAKVNKKKGK